MIKIKNLTKIYPKMDQPALNNINLEIEPGKITVLFGENGAGKTTLIKIMSCLLKPNEGNCSIKGFDTQEVPLECKKITGMLMGAETGLYARLTAYENIKYFADLNEMKPNAFKKRLNYFIKIFSMKEFLNRKCGEFSFGMKQKTSITRAFIHNPELILLDEPSTGLDITSSLVMHDFIRKCKKEKKTVIFSSHRVDEIEKLADRIIIIKDGEIKFDSKFRKIPKNKKYETFLTGFITEK